MDAPGSARRKRSARRSIPSQGGLRPPPLEDEALEALLLELRIHGRRRCERCYLAEVGWHEAVCLTPGELTLLRRLLRDARGTGRGGTAPPER